jgi:hypothetical protein
MMRPTARAFASFSSLVLTAAAGCASSGFEVASVAADAPAPDGPDAAVQTDGATGDVAASSDVVTVDATSCPPSDGVTLYVDKAASGPSSGAEACPFKTIREALEFIDIKLSPGTERTVRVAPGVYDESDGVRVKGKTRVVGAGESKTTVKGGSSGCPAPAGCVVVVQDSASLSGVTIESGERVGLYVAPASGATAKVSSTIVRGPGKKPTGAAGVIVDGAGSAELGPSFQSVSAQATALVVVAAASVRVVNSVSPAPPNRFNDSALGIQVQKGKLEFLGGEAMGNTGAGLLLASGAAHAVTKLVARDNFQGIVVEAPASLTLRGSTLLGNARMGIVAKGAPPKLDLGTASSVGDNVLHAPSAPDANGRGGVCFSTAFNTGAIPAYGNAWSTCAGADAIKVVALGPANCESVTGSADVFYTAMYPGPVIDATKCRVGP